MSTEEPPAADHRTVNADANTTIKEAHNVIETLVVKLSRQELYDKIWEVSVAGVSKEYGIPYSQLLKQVKAADIPVPPSGYWTKLSFRSEEHTSELQSR